MEVEGAAAVQERATSAENALRLVRLLADRGTLRVSEAAKHLGVTPPTAYRLIGSLCKEGFAAQDVRNGPYRPGPVLRELGLAALGAKDVRTAARRILERLTSATGETVSLGVLDGRDVLFIDGIEGHRTVRVGNRIGVHIPAHCTAAGKAMLAALTPAELQRRYADRVLTRRTEQSIRDWDALESELAAVRTAGFARNTEEGEAGVCAVSAAVLDASGAPVAAVNVVIPSSRMPSPQKGAEGSGAGGGGAGVAGAGAEAAVVEAAAEVSAALRSW